MRRLDLERHLRTHGCFLARGRQPRHLEKPPQWQSPPGAAAPRTQAWNGPRRLSPTGTPTAVISRRSDATGAVSNPELFKPANRCEVGSPRRGGGSASSRHARSARRCVACLVSAGKQLWKALMSSSWLPDVEPILFFGLRTAGADVSPADRGEPLPRATRIEPLVCLALTGEVSHRIRSPRSGETSFPSLFP